MQRVRPDRPWPLYDVAATRRLEQHAAAALPPHALMQRAGRAVARLALAIQPHARTVWVAAGPGNNGGDGFEAAVHLARAGKEVVVTWLGTPEKVPPDAHAALLRARAAGVHFMQDPPPHWDLGLDALLGIGARRMPQGRLGEWMERLNAHAAPVLAIDLPSGLDADTGQAGLAVRAAHTLALLALKPGLFTGRGRDCAGTVWFDDLGVDVAPAPAGARLVPPPATPARLHASHKGSYGDVAVVGGAAGMAGAALLAARAALHHGAGRVFVGLLDPQAPSLDPVQPDLMVRDAQALAVEHMAVACGCGGGEAVREALPPLLARARALVLDADALNAIAADAALQQQLRARTAATVLTPHPLEAARLLGTQTAGVQADRLAAARTLAARHGCVVALKGSGTVVAEPDGSAWINATGNARLAVAGTGDVLAGWIAARLAAGEAAAEATRAAVYLHGAAADAWPEGAPLTAAALAAGGR